LELEALLILFEQAQGGAPEPGEVFLGAAMANPGLVLAEAPIEGPVQAILDPPVLPHALGDAGAADGP
jgi:hypothetical protein